MHIHPDTNALIDLLERGRPLAADAFDVYLRERGTTLIVSLFNVFELAAPLIEANPHANALATLNRLERLPVVYFSMPRTSILEIQEATRAFSANTEFQRQSPFVTRFDDALTLSGKAPTRQFFNYPLSEIVFTLWAEDPQIFRRATKRTPKLRELFTQDRAMKKTPSLKTHTVHHHLRMNVQDIPRNGDFGDFDAVSCIPYADYATLDARMAGYVRQASASLSMTYHERIHSDLDALMKSITN